MSADAHRPLRVRRARSGAAGAEDATILWSNAAGMSRLREHQVVGALHLIKPSIKFKNENSAAAAGQTSLGGEGGEGGDAGGLNVVPNLYFVAPLGPQWSFGLGLNSPFGLVTEYDEGWIGRFQALKSSIKTINVNPAVAWKLVPRVGVGLGLNFQRIDAEFTNNVNYSGALLNAAVAAGVVAGSPQFVAIAQATPGLESRASIEGTDNAWGWNAGVLWELDDKTRAGAHYRSSIKYSLQGDAKFTNPTPAATGNVPLDTLVAQLATGVNTSPAGLSNTAITSDVKLPAILNLSYFATLNDQSPVPNADRTPRLPDAERTWLALGAQYRIGPNLTFDAGAAYVLVKKASIDNRGGSAVNANGRLAGRYDSNTLIASGQVSYSF